MKNIKVLLTISAIVSSLLLIGQINANVAIAQSFQVLSGFAYPIKAMHYQADNDLIWVLTASSSSSGSVLYWIDRGSLSIVGNFNHTTAISGGAGNRAQDIWCGKTDCFITTANIGGTDGQLLRISTEDISPNIFRGQNVTGTYTHATGGLHHLTGRDQVNGGFGSITMWVDACNDEPACNTEKIYIIDGISMLTSESLPQVNSGSTIKSHELRWSEIEGITDNHLVEVKGSFTPNVSANHLIIYNLATLTVLCDVQLPLIAGQVANGLSVATNYVSAGSSNNKVYVSAHSGYVFVYDDSCNLLQTVTSALTGLTSDARFIEYDAGRVFIQESGANAKISQMLTNSSGHIITGNNTLYFPLPSVSQIVFDPVFGVVNVHNMILFAGFGKLWFPYSGSEQEIGILSYDTVAGQAEEICFDINSSPQTTTILCLTDNDGDGIPDMGSPLQAWRATRNITSIGNDFFCQLGVLSDLNSDGVCDNYNVQENGVGYLYWFLLFIGMSLLASMAIHGKKTDQLHIMIYVVLLTASSAMASGFGWINNVLFFVSIFAVAGFGGVKLGSQIIGIVRRDGD